MQLCYIIAIITFIILIYYYYYYSNNNIQNYIVTKKDTFWQMWPVNLTENSDFLFLQ